MQMTMLHWQQHNAEGQETVKREEWSQAWEIMQNSNDTIEGSAMTGLEDGTGKWGQIKNISLR